MRDLPVGESAGGQIGDAAFLRGQPLPRLAPSRRRRDGATGGAQLPVGRGHPLHGTEPGEVEGRTVVHAEVPQHELSRYPIDLRSVSHGTGTFTRSFLRYDYMPAALAREVASTSA